MFDILYMRRNQMMMENSFPHELQTAYKGMEPPATRGTWPAATA
jgi:hypothetical protein